MKIGVAIVALALVVVVFNVWMLAGSPLGAAFSRPGDTAVQQDEIADQWTQAASLRAKRFATLDDWVRRGGPASEVQEAVVKPCGDLVMLTASINDLTALATDREAFHFRADVCAKMVANRVYPQPEFEKPDVVSTICDSKVDLYRQLCKRSGLR